FLSFFNVFGHPPIIPQPSEILVKEGSFIIDGNTALRFKKNNQKENALAEYLQKHIQKISGYKTPLNAKGKNSIEFKIRKLDSIGDEGYLMDISSSKILIQANSEKGLFYGVQSLMQLMPAI